MEVDALLAAELLPAVESPAELQEALRGHLAELVATARHDAQLRDQALADEGWFGSFLIYSGAFLLGAGRMVGDVLEVGGALISTAVSVNPMTSIPADIAHGRMPFTTSVEAIQSIVDGTGVAVQQAGEAVRVIDLLARDPQTWDILVGFQSEYIGALHSTVLTEYGGGIGLNLLVALVTGGAGLALAAGKGAAITAKISRILARLSLFRSDGYLASVESALDRVAQACAERYLRLPPVMAAVKKHGRAPSGAAVLWAPWLRPQAFFGVSQSFERTLNPLVTQEIDAVAPDAARAWKSVGQPNSVSQHGRCAEPVAISRGIKFMNRSQGRVDGTGRPRGVKLTLAGSYCLAVSLRLEGKPERMEKGRLKGGTKAYSRKTSGLAKHQRFGEHRQACHSCRLILGRLKIIDVLGNTR